MKKKKNSARNIINKLRPALSGKNQGDRYKRPLIGVSFALAFVGIGAWTLITSFAAPYELYISPNVGEVTKGQEFSVSLRLDPGTAVDGVTATIAYDIDFLELVAIDSSNSAFPVFLEEIGGDGMIVITRGVFAPSTITGDSLVATITFNALNATSNPTTLDLTGNASYAGSYTNPQPISATVTIVDPDVVPDTGQTDTQPPAVAISSPHDGVTIKRKETLNATATDNVDVVGMEVLFDGSVVANSASGVIKYNINLKSKRIAKGPHDITVRAFDAAGNEATNSITVYK